jgi:hypothetical protein
MSSKLTRAAYERLIEEDIACVLAEMAPSLERTHVVDVLRASPSREYDAEIDRLRAAQAAVVAAWDDDEIGRVDGALIDALRGAR